MSSFTRWVSTLCYIYRCVIQQKHSICPPPAHQDNDDDHQFSSVQSLDRLGRRGHVRDDSADILFQSFLQEALVSSSGMARDLSSLNVVHPAFPLQTTALPTLKGALKSDFEEATAAGHMPEPCKFPSHDSCQRRFLLTHKELLLLRTQSLVLCSQWEMKRSFP